MNPYRRWFWRSGAFLCISLALLVAWQIGLLARQYLAVRHLEQIGVDVNQVVTWRSNTEFESLDKFLTKLFSRATSIDYSGQHLDRSALDSISLLPEITRITIYNSSISPKGLAVLKSCRKLQWLYLCDLPGLKNQLEFVQHLPELTKVTLTHNSLSEDDFRSLSSIRNLKFLNISETNISKSAINTLARCKQLEEIYAWQTKVGAECLELAGHLDELKVIHLEGCDLSQNPRIHFVRNVTLNRLILSNCQLNDTNLKSIISRFDAEEMILSDNPITDASIPVISSIPSLKKLKIQNTQISEEGIQQLIDSLPNCQIESHEKI